MPYSDTHRYIHIRVPKTASSSVTKSLRLAHREQGGVFVHTKGKVDAEFKEKYNLKCLDMTNAAQIQHLSAREMKHIMGNKYDEYFSFSFVRNPWALVVSNYNYSHISNKPSPGKIKEIIEKKGYPPLRKFHDKPFDVWLEEHVPKLKAIHGKTSFGLKLGCNQLAKLCDINGEIIVDFVGHLESIDRDLPYIFSKIGLTLDKVRHRNRSTFKSYTDYYNHKTRAIVAELYALDIERFGYEFTS